jgi:hypothetical protein
MYLSVAMLLPRSCVLVVWQAASSGNSPIICSNVLSGLYSDERQR